MKIILMVRQGSACDYHRVEAPFRYMEAENGDHIVTLQDVDQVRVSEFRAADLVVFNRHPTVDLETLIMLRKKFGFKIWVDIDDYWELYPEHYMYDNWKRSKMSEKIIQSMAEADIVTVTNKRLLRKVLTINDKVKVIPNGVPIGYEQFALNREESTRLRFIYAGGPSHVKDLGILESFFNDIKSALSFYENSEFILAGYSDRYVDENLKRMNQIMSAAPRYSTRLGLPLNRYMEHYNYADASLAPLADNEFNSYKSNLKVIEAGCMRMPIICSKVYPYLEDLEMKSSGIFFCENTTDWYEACKMLIDNPHMVLEYGDKLHEYVRLNYNLLVINKLRRDIINSFKK